MNLKNIFTAVFVSVIVLTLKAQQSKEDLARVAQNPVANCLSIPFQNNTNFGYGPNNDRVQNMLEIEPVIPFFDGKLITRTIFPLVWQPDWTESSGSSMGLSNVQITAFYVPKTKNIIMGVGPILSLPAASASFGSEKWGIGPSLVMVKMTKKWVFGFLVNNVWSFAGKKDAVDENSFLLQYAITYNMKDGLYVNTAPIVTANWEASSGQQWIVPLGLGVGKIVTLGGKLPLNLQAGYYYNVVAPDFGPKSQIRLQVSLLLPTSLF